MKKNLDVLDLTLWKKNVFCESMCFIFQKYQKTYLRLTTGWSQATVKSQYLLLTFNGIIKSVQAGSQLGEDSWGAGLWHGILPNTWDTFYSESTSCIITS